MDRAQHPQPKGPGEAGRDRPPQQRRRPPGWERPMGRAQHPRSQAGRVRPGATGRPIHAADPRAGITAWPARSTPKAEGSAIGRARFGPQGPLSGAPRFRLFDLPPTAPCAGGSLATGTQTPRLSPDPLSRPTGWQRPMARPITARTEGESARALGRRVGRAADVSLSQRCAMIAPHWRVVASAAARSASQTWGLTCPCVQTKQAPTRGGRGRARLSAHSPHRCGRRSRCR